MKDHTNEEGIKDWDDRSKDLVPFRLRLVEFNNVYYIQQGETVRACHG